MTDSITRQILRNSLTLSYAEIEQVHPDWSKVAIDDYFYKQSNINTLAISAQGLEAQVILNTDNIEINADNIVIIDGNLTDHINDTDGAHAASAISFDNSGGLAATDVQGAIDEVDGDLTTHVNANSAHGAGGDVVGNTDFATSGVGGVVNLASTVALAAFSTVNVGNPDATDLPSVIILANELKQDVNFLVGDLNAAITQLNAFLAANKTAKQMA